MTVLYLTSAHSPYIPGNILDHHTKLERAGGEINSEKPVFLAPLLYFSLSWNLEITAAPFIAFPWVVGI